jgi:organic hydroperoxide reductase OsmC/OhrA
VVSFRVVRSAQASWQGTLLGAAEAGAAFDITRIEPRTVGDVPGVDQALFTKLAEQAKNCTVSRVMTGTEITLEASLERG